MAESGDGILGDRAVVPRPNPALPVTVLALTPEEAFVFTRVDGFATLGQLCQITGLGEDATRRILAKLRAQGAVLFPGDAPGRPPASPSAAPHAPARAPALPPYDPALLSEPCDLPIEVRRRVMDVWSVLNDLDLFRLLEVGDDAAPRDLKRAYFRLAKEFHPDRHYGKSLGSFGQRLQDVFKRLTFAFELLSDPQRRDAYLKRREELVRAGRPPGAAAGDDRTATARPPTPPSTKRPRPAAPVPAAEASSIVEQSRRLGQVVRSDRAVRARRFHDDGMAHLKTGHAVAAARLLRMAVALMPQSAGYQEIFRRCAGVALDDVNARLSARARAAEAAGFHAAALRLADLRRKAGALVGSARRSELESGAVPGAG